MRRSLALSAISLVLVACSSNPTGGGDPDPILVYGSDMGPRYQNFSLSRGSTPITDAVVTINGTVLPASATGSYNYDLGQTLQPGEQLLIRVVQGGEVVEGRATIIAAPTLTAPTPNQLLTLGQPLTFTWTATSQPDYWRVALLYNSGGGGASVGDSLPPSARSTTLATTAVPANATNLTAGLYSYLRGSFTGRIDPASRMSVRTGELTVNILKGQ